MNFEDFKKLCLESVNDARSINDLIETVVNKVYKKGFEAGKRKEAKWVDGMRLIDANALKDSIGKDDKSLIKLIDQQPTVLVTLEMVARLLLSEENE